MRTEKKEINQGLLIATVCLMLCFAPICQFANLLCGTIFGEPFSLDTLLCYAALLGMLLASFIQLHGRIKLDVLYFVVLLILAYALTYILAKGNRRYMFTEWSDFAANPLYQLFVYSVPAYVLMRYITDYGRLLDTFYRFALAVVLCSVGTLIITVAGDSQPEYMDFSYNLLFSTLFLTVCFFERKKIPALAAAITGVVLIFFAGARGPLLCCFVGVAGYLLLRSSSPSRKLIAVVSLVILGLLAIVLWDQLLSLLSRFSKLLGIRSRSIEMLLNGEFFSDSGRGEIQKRVISSFSLLGSGLFGDRIAGEGFYAHNLIIEIIAQWGYLLGTVIVVALGVLFWRGIRTKNLELRWLIVVLLASSVMKLMLSGSYLMYNSGFFLLLAACVNSLDRAEQARPWRKMK